MSSWVRGVDILAGIILIFPILFNFLTAENSPPGYLDPTRNPDSNYSKVSCDFSHSSCGWENVGGEDYPMTWVKKGHYMHLDMDEAGDDKKGRLVSPWLDPLQSHACFLRFRYFIRSPSSWDCQLSLLRESFRDEDMLIWRTQKPTGLFAFSGPITNEINCTGEDFRIVFEGKGSCKVRWYDEIDIKAITLRVQPLYGPAATDRTPPAWTEDVGQVFTISHNDTEGLVIDSTTVRSFSSSSHVHALTSAAATTEVVDTGSSTKQQMKDDNDDQKSSGLDPGVAAGIIIAIIIVIIVFIVLFIFVIVFIRRRRQKDRAMKRSIKCKTTCAVANAVYMQGRAETTGSNRAEEENRRQRNASDNQYELADMGPASNASPPPPNNYDDIPTNYDHIDHTTSTTPTSPNSYDHVNTGAQPPDAAITTTTSNTNAYSNIDLTPDSPSANTHGCNRLPPFPDHSTDTYDHTAGAPLLKISRNGDNYDHVEQPSPAPLASSRPYENSNIYIDMEGSINQSGSSCYTQPDPGISTQKQEVENSTASAARFAQMGTTEYETVGDVAEAMMTSSGGCAGGGGGGGGGDDDAYNSLDFEGERRREEVAVENVYDHAKDESYDSLNHEGRRREQQRHLARNDYHHV